MPGSGPQRITTEQNIARSLTRRRVQNRATDSGSASGPAVRRCAPGPSSRARRAPARSSSSSCGHGRARDLASQQLDDHAAHRLDRLAHGGQRRLGAVHERGVVVADDRDVGGHALPGRRTARIAPRAMRVARAHDARDAGRRAGGSRRPGRPRASTASARRGSPSRAIRVAAGDAGARHRACGCDGTWSAGPSSRPIRRWPSESRWPIACSIATASSQATRGKPRPSMAALTSTVGSLRSRRRA